MLSAVPELSSRPLLASALDAELFVDREAELAALERSATERLNALVVGEAGVGKTSLLHQLERRFDGHAEVEPVFVEGARRVEHPEELLSLIALRIDADRARLAQAGELAQAIGARSPRGATERLLAALGSVREALAAAAARRPLLILDELASGAVAHALFGQLRDELWSLPATWVVAAEAGERAAYLRPPASAFFETVIAVGPLDEADALELLRRRTAGARIPRRVLREVAAAAGGNPRRVLTLARDSLLEGLDPAEAASEHAARARLARELGEAASRLVAYLETNGAASASDERMLSELGWGRSRATQVLRQLERAGLVDAASERSNSSRRKLYTLSDQRERVGA